MTKLFAAFLICASSALSAEVIFEKSKDLGFEFREVKQLVQIPKGHVEGTGHFSFLYFEEYKVSQASDFLISSDGKFAIFTDGPTGNVQVFLVADKHCTPRPLCQRKWHT